jgi:hypothetical protein
MTAPSTGTTVNQSINQSNHVLKKERKKERGRIQRTFDIPLDSEYDTLLGKEADLLRLERYAGWSRADLCRRAWAEYVAHHHPGNPTIPLTHWTTGEPLSMAAQEKMLIPCQTRTCDFCHGTGKDPTDPFGLRCGACGGHGTVIIE